MKENRSKDGVFLLFILAVSVMSILYFSVPERMDFIKNQIKWWGELWDIVKSLWI
ncbi:MAG: hypothetical protein V3R54_09275 [Thermodesulfovibrionia bacterium]